MNASLRERKYFARHKMVKTYARLMQAGYFGYHDRSIIVNWQTVKDGKGRLPTMIKEVMNERQAITNENKWSNMKRYAKNREINDKRKGLPASKNHAWISWGGKTVGRKARCTRCGIIKENIGGVMTYFMDNKEVPNPGCVNNVNPQS